MDDKPRTESPGPKLPWAVAWALAVLCLAGWLLGVGTGIELEDRQPDSFVIFYQFLRGVVWPVAVAAVILVSSVSVGAALLSVLRVEPREPSVRLLFAAAIGLGVSAYATLALGMLGFMSRGAFWALAVVMLLAGCRPLVRAAGSLGRQARGWAAGWGWFEWSMAVGGALLLLVGILCVRTPLLDYDTLEYHLGAPAEHFAAGKVRFLPHNVYAAFPEHVEMLYLEGMILCGSKSAGMAVAIAIQVLFGALAAGAVGAIAARHLRREAGLPAAVFFLTCPLFIVTIMRGHITLARCFYTAAALLAVIQWIYGREDIGAARRSWLILGGLCCGLAVAVKYSAAVLLCAPLGLAVLAVSFRRSNRWGERLAAPAILAGCALIAVLPWLVKSLAATGNPVFPLLYGVFGGRGWTAQQAAKFARAHAPLPFAGLPLEVWRFLCGYTSGMSAGFAGPLAVVFVPLLLVGFRRSAGAGVGRKRAGLGPTGFLVCYGVVMIVIWGVATHRIARFLAPLLVILPPLSAAGLFTTARRTVARKLCHLVAVLAVAHAVWSHATVAYIWGGLGGAVAGERLAELAHRLDRTKLTAYAEAVGWLNDPQNVPPDGAVLLVGEARVFYFERRLLYSAVFNDHPIEPALQLADQDVPQAVAALRATGATHLLVNWPEVARLSTSYRYRREGSTHAGYLPQLDLPSRQPLLRLLNAAGSRVQAFGQTGWPDDEPKEGIPIIEIYELAPRSSNSRVPGRS